MTNPLNHDDAPLGTQSAAEWADWWQNKKPDTDRYMTLEEVAEVMGVTRERVRQIEQRALRKLAAMCKERGITFSDL